MRPRRSELDARYGEIINGYWSNLDHFIVTIDIPKPLQSRFRYIGQPIRKIRMNKDMVVPFNTATGLIIKQGATKLITSYSGCFNIRNVRGGTQISSHAYGLAIDLNAEMNPLGGPSNMDQIIIDCFEEGGFVWGGNFKRTDPMHFQYLTEN